MELVNNQNILFAKTKEGAIIPSKRKEDGCYDIYACFDEDYIEIPSGEIKFIPTGLASAFNSNYRFDVRERGSTGTKGLARRSGQMDSGFRNEWFIVINNTSNKPIIICKKDYLNKNEYLKTTQIITVYPYEKAICQAALEFVPDVDVVETTYDKLLEYISERGIGSLGSSNK